MKDNFEADFSNCISFAALMALLETIDKGDETGQLDITGYHPYDSNKEVAVFDPEIDITKGKERLTLIAQSIFDEADRICDTHNDIKADDIITSLLQGLFSEAILSLDVPQNVKSSIFNFASKYSRLETDINGDALFMTDDSELVNLFSQLANQVVNTIIVGASKSKIQIGFGFAKALAEYLCYVESAIAQKFPSAVFQKRLPIIALDKFIDSAKSIMEEMEAEDPGIKSHPDTVNTQQQEQHLNDLYLHARAALDTEQYIEAQRLFEKIMAENPEDWEATFYFMYCGYASEGRAVRPTEIEPNCCRAGAYACKAIGLMKRQLFSRGDILHGLGSVSTKMAALASDYFVAAMNEFNRSRQNVLKVQRVNAIIKMMFDVGDAIEKNFPDDAAVCSATACECWKIALTCYENCNMPAPASSASHSMKIRRYEPSYHCSKPLNESNRGGGCYVATAVYGSYDCPQVWTLRRYRDYVLAESWYGRTFIRIYYAVSPTMVKWFGNTRCFQKIFKTVLDRIIDRLQKSGVSSNPYKDC